MWSRWLSMTHWLWVILNESLLSQRWSWLPSTIWNLSEWCREMIIAGPLSGRNIIESSSLWSSYRWVILWIWKIIIWLKNNWIEMFKNVRVFVRKSQKSSLRASEQSPLTEMCKNARKICSAPNVNEIILELSGIFGAIFWHFELGSIFCHFFYF